MPQHPTPLEVKQLFTVHVPLNTCKHCSGLVPGLYQVFEPLLLLKTSKTTPMSILFGCVVKHVWKYRA